MPERKIKELPSLHAKRALCRAPDHEPAKHVVREPGLYEHTCSECGKITAFVVPYGPTWEMERQRYPFMKVIENPDE